ncbi:hypothetical protein DFJ74DRAFT_374966 [Hyaloraphidium curvatum]|nr:hypothetical protein DFJ74DRAFT_374966 [Hyaloraphidium curvatum]
MCRIEFPEETDEDAHEARVMRLAGALASMPKLVSLEISLYWGVCGASKLLEASSCPGRRSLKLNGVAFSGHSLRSCLRALHQLQTLRVCGAVTEDSEVLDALAEAAPSSLESLIVNRDTAYEDETEDLETALEDRHLSQIVDSVRNLKVLDLDQCAKLTDASFGPAFGKFLELAEVRLKFCSKVTDATLLKLASPCLRELVLDSAVGVGDASIVPILRQNTHIEWLNLRKTGVTDAIVPHLHASRSTINDLNLSRTSVTWSALKPLIEADPPLLEYLAVSYLAGVDDDAVLCIREHLKELVALRLAGCGGIRKAETLLYTVFRLKGTLDTLCVRDVPVADGEN